MRVPDGASQKTYKECGTLAGWLAGRVRASAIGNTAVVRLHPPDWIVWADGRATAFFVRGLIGTEGAQAGPAVAFRFT